MPVFVTLDAKRDQIFQCIMAELTSAIQMMDFQHCCGTAILAAPSIPIQDLNPERFVAHQIQFQSGLFLAYSLHMYLAG
jgi:hypothetical protein